VVFSTLGYAGLYLLIGLVFVYLIARQVGRGPAPAPGVA
jgi:cytochrome bd-type quinol oxidase subunit 1